MRAPARKIAAGLLVAVGVAYVSEAGYAWYWRHSAEETLEAVLHGFARGSIPSGVEGAFDSRSPEKIAASLQGGFEVIGEDNILFSMRNYEFKVKTADGLFLTCDVIHQPPWRVSCVQFSR